MSFCPQKFTLFWGKFTEPTCCPRTGWKNTTQILFIIRCDCSIQQRAKDRFVGHYLIRNDTRHTPDHFYWIECNSDNTPTGDTFFTGPPDSGGTFSQWAQKKQPHSTGWWWWCVLADLFFIGSAKFNTHVLIKSTRFWSHKLLTHCTCCSKISTRASFWLWRRILIEPSLASSSYVLCSSIFTTIICRRTDGRRNDTTSAAPRTNW